MSFRTYENRLLFFLSNKQADDYFAALGYEAHKDEFCHRRGVFFYRNRCTIGLACAQAVALRVAPTTARRHVSAPRKRNQSHPLARDDGAVNNDGHQKAKRNWFYYGRKDP